MSVGKITFNSTNEISWKLNFIWILVPFTIACGIWGLGTGWEIFAWCIAVFATVFVGGVAILRLLGHIVTIDPGEKMLLSLCGGFIWGAAMIFTWPGDWIGPVYLIVIFLNFCLLEIKRPKKG
ncbi:hypothetical protein LCGC14_2071380 [marine sediment metagenome]|uniref:Uncharacterized protein n=1 Tax=marine sediment metagenome TaxID=412755 RepID=A0A0F9EIH8_9ZZZZ